MKIIIICVDNTNYPVSLELNKKYEATQNGNYYCIIDENFEDYKYPIEIFKVISHQS
jgi:hypothetical protein